MEKLSVRDLTPETLKKIQEMKSAEELIAFGKENGYEVSPELADRILKQFQSIDELNDDELEAVSGGGTAFEEYQKRLGKLIPENMCL